MRWGEEKSTFKTVPMKVLRPTWTSLHLAIHTLLFHKSWFAIFCCALIAAVGWCRAVTQSPLNLLAKPTRLAATAEDAPRRPLPCHSCGRRWSANAKESYLTLQRACILNILPVPRPPHPALKDYPHIYQVFLPWCQGRLL